MATYTFDKIDYGGNTYVVSDSGALQLTGGQVTGPVTFGDSVSIDEATLGDLVVNGSASFTNNIQANTINGVTVGNSPKFTDTNTEVSTLTLTTGSTAGTSLTFGGKFTLTAGSKTVSFTMPTIPTASSSTLGGVKVGYTTSGNNRAVQIDSNGNLYVVQKDDNSDEKVKLTSQATSGTYPLVFGPTSITSNSTYQGYYNTGITVNPSTKTVTATTFVGALTGTASGNLTSSSTLDATKLSGTIPTSCYTNTKNTAGTTNKTGTKMFLVAATEQSANPTTYSNSNCYIGTDNCLYSGGTKVLTAHQDISDKIDTPGTGLSKTGTTLNHTNSVSAQTTQAIYPIKIDAQGHISAYGSAVTIPTNIVTTITTTAGTHITRTNATGAVGLTIPTKTSHLTNDSGFISTAAQIIRW